MAGDQTLLWLVYDNHTKAKEGFYYEQIYGDYLYFGSERFHGRT